MAVPTSAGLPPLGMPPAMDMGMGMGMGMLPVPGLDVIQKLLLSLGLDPTHLMSLGMALTVLASLGGFLRYAMNGLHSLWTFLYNNCISSAEIHSSDQAYLYIMKWLATNRVSTDCRKFCVTSRKNPNSARVKRFSMYNFHHGRTGQDDEEDDEEEDDLGPKLKYNPAPGLSYFWYRKHLIIMQRVPEHHGYLNSDAPDETMVLMTIGRSPNLLRELLAEARSHYLHSESRKTTVYTVNTSNFQKSWDNGRSRASRDISTVIMEDKDKELILRDTKDYLNPVTARWYAARGLPYRRGYLFYGPPGTGKTSLTLALAGELKLNLYIFNLGAGGGVTDETLGQLFQALPKKCIVLLEDIDCAGIGRSQNFPTYGYGDPYNTIAFSEEDEEEESGEEAEGGDKQEESTDSRDAASQKSGSSGSATLVSKSDSDEGGASKPRGNNKPTGPPRMVNPMRNNSNNNNKSQISFSGLLNAIDGVASHEGRILIMTTNHRERLDPALIRPGRVDVQIEFGFANKTTITRVFTELYKGLNDLPEQCSPPIVTPVRDFFEDPIYQPSPVESMHSEYSFPYGKKDSHSIDTLAEKFASAVPAGMFTPAELQGFLMMHKHNPQRAVADVAGWVEKKLSEKGGLGRRGRAKSKKSTGKSSRRGSWQICDSETITGGPITAEPLPITPSNDQSTWSPPKETVSSSATVTKAGKSLPKLSELKTNVGRIDSGGQQCNATGANSGKGGRGKGRPRRGNSVITT